MSKVKTTVAIVLFITISGVLASLLLPTPEKTTALAFHLLFGLAYGSFALFVGASTLFIMGFGAFKTQLKRAYTLVCIGMMFIGLAMLELPLLLSAGLLDNLIKNNSGLLAIPFAAALIILVVGTTLLARLFSVKSVTVTWWFSLVVVAIASVVVVFLPHVPTAISEATFDASNIVNAFICSILTINMVHALQIKRVAGLAYTEAMAWLALAFGASVVVALGGLLGRLLFGDDEAYIITALTLVPLAPAGLLFLRSAYAFNLITSKILKPGDTIARNFFGKPLHERSSAGISSIDIVVYAAQLASNPQSLDSLLDKLRAITSQTREGGALTLSADEEKTLKNVYLEIEAYLTSEEPVRKFTQQELRQQIADNLHLTADSSQRTFWGVLVMKTEE